MHLKTFDNMIDARLFASKLESEEIQTYLENENTITLDPLLSNALGGVRLKVAESDFLVAQKLLLEYSAKPIVDDEGMIIHCPQCGSNKLENGVRDFSGVKGVISFLVALFLFVVPLNSSTSYRCLSCGHLFKDGLKEEAHRNSEESIR